ncbi:histidine kinase [Fluviicola taffensis]|uniref:sensor histidine kinase n=1 Tax=Fluviicola taffensis TaxID=191579 RepID=UPI0031377B70
MHFQLIKHFLWGIFFVGITSVAAAQGNRISWEYNYDHFGIENGLPSSESYQVYQDKSGLLWILTDRGVVRYDGFEFRKYTVENGLSDNVNFRLVEAPNGAIWFIGYNGMLSVFEKGEMKPYVYNHKLEKAVSLVKNPHVLLHVNADRSIIYGASDKKMIAVTNKGKARVISDKLGKEGYFFEFGDQVMAFKNRETPLDSYNTYFIRNNKKVLAGKLIFGTTMRFKRHQNHLFLMASRKLYLNYQQQFKLFPENAEVISLDSDGQFLYVGLYKNGLKKYRFNPKTKTLVLVNHYLSNYSGTSVCKDRNGTLWITTLEKGLFAIYDESFSQLFVNGTNLDEDIRFINGNKDNVVITCYVGKWQQLYPPFLCKEVGKTVLKYNLLPVKNGFAFEKGTVNWGDWKDVDATYPFNPVYATDSSVVGINYNGDVISEIIGKSVVTTNIEEIYSSGIGGGINLFFMTSKRKLVILRNEGLFTFKIGNGRVLMSTQKLLSKRINFLEYNKEWGVVAISNTGEIFSVNAEKDKLEKLVVKANIGKQILNVFFDEKKRLWIATQKGLFLFVKKKEKVIVCSFLNKCLLSSGEINDLYSYKDVVYLATKFGVQKIDFRKVKKVKKGCPIGVFSILAFDKNKKLPKSKVYPATTDLIKIFLSNKLLTKRTSYKYRFGKDQTWISSDKGEIIINNPVDGNYDLEVSFLNEQNDWTESKVLASFRVEKIIFLRWYFILIYIALVGILFYAILRYTVGAVNRKNHLLNRMMELERMALAAQMNPHFIFNSLNSIHSFLLYEENENAEKYLIRFARLIRQTLANSRMSFITIEEECETLKNYILLEKMRFKDAFIFTIECEPRQMPSYPCIPPMLIQPYVENAILHGLVKRPNGGELFLKLYQENDLLKVLIQDNGIGYAASKKEKKDSKHKSYGTQITEERLKSLQGKNSAYSVSIDTADSSDTEFPGTRVIVTIPINTN